MKKTILILPFLGLTLSMATAQTEPAPDSGKAAPAEPMRARFQEALFAEEVDRDLGKALKAYTEVLRLFEGSRETAATAAYRLGEVHRKLAGGNPESEHHGKAAQQYERVIREFGDIGTLATLSEENLVAMGRTPPGPDTMAAGDAETQRIRELEEWRKISPDKLTETPTPLYQAALENQLRVADFLIRSGVDLERGERDITPLGEAAGAGHLAMVEKLLEAGAAPRPARGIPPIHHALINDRMAVVGKLIEVGAHLDVRDGTGNPPLMALIKKPELKTGFTVERALEYASLLAKTGVDVNETNPQTGETSLLVAMSVNLPKVVGWLLANGSEVNTARKEDGATPLILAAKANNAVWGQRLLEMGAEVNRADTKGIAPLHYILNQHNPNPKFVELLLQEGADVNQRIGAEGQTPLHGWTPLHVWAAMSRNDEIGRMLYRAGGNPIAFSGNFPSGLKDVASDNPGTPLAILERRRSRHQPILREFYEEGLKTLAPGDFAQAVWFLMPPNQSDRRKHPRSGEAPSPHLPNLLPLFDRGDADSGPPNLASLIVEAFAYRGSLPKQAKPKFDTVRILRPTAAANGGQQEWKTLPIPYKELIAKGDPSADPSLQWGDVVLFDQEQGRETGEWNRFDDVVVAHLYRAASVTFRLTLGNLSEEVRIVPESDYKQESVPGDYELSRYDRIPTNGRNIGQFTQHRGDLDLSAIRIRRQTGGAATDLKMSLATDKGGEFFLKEGDEVVVPFREGIAGMMPKDRSKAIWISRPGTHVLERAEGRYNFEKRNLESLPLVRVLASYYASGGLPFPDFDRIRIIDASQTPDQAGKLVSLAKNPTEPVPWGSILQIPMKEDTDPASWTGLSNDERTQLAALSKITFTIEPEGMEKRQMDFHFTFPSYKRGEKGELLRLPDRNHRNNPFITHLFWDEFMGENAKWDLNRVVLQSGGQSLELSASGVALLKGDVVKFFRKL